MGRQTVQHVPRMYAYHLAIKGSLQFDGNDRGGGPAASAQHVDLTPLHPSEYSRNAFCSRDSQGALRICVHFLSLNIPDQGSKCSSVT